MTAINLFNAFDEWGRLSAQEGEAIQSGNWCRVDECQNAKDVLRSFIVQLQQRALDETPIEELDSLRARIKSQINQLIEQEQKNQELLKNLLQASRQEQADLDHQESTLRKLKRSYSFTRPAVWHTYS